jgi:cytochrome P450
MIENEAAGIHRRSGGSEHGAAYAVDSGGRVDSGSPVATLRSLLEVDPYPVYAQLRQVGRVFWQDELRHWVVTRHAEADTILRDPRFSANRSRWEGYRPPPGQEAPSPMMTDVDPPDHTRLRNLVQQAFTPRTVEQMRARVSAYASELLAAARARGEVDLVEALAYPLPVLVIAALLGVPSEDREEFQRWSADMADSMDPTTHGPGSESGGEARNQLRRYLAGIVERRRREPQDDMISRLVAAEEQGDRLSEDELLDMCVLLLAAGHETTVNLIGNGVNALLDHPEELARLRAHPELMESAVEEFLRYDSPVQMNSRVPIEDVTLAGSTLRAGQMILVLVGSANRDPDEFPDPDRFDVARGSSRHLAFGRGIHFCLAAPLARMEAQIAIAHLLESAPGLRRAGEPTRRPNPVFRGLASLPVAL